MTYLGRFLRRSDHFILRDGRLRLLDAVSRDAVVRHAVKAVQGSIVTSLPR